MTSDPRVPPLHVRAMGVTVEIAVPDQPTRDRLARQWSRAVVPAPDEPAAAHTTAQPGPKETEASRDYGLTTQVTMAALRATAGRRINLHAGGVADERRRVLAVVGPSGTGKTTATVALARRLGYVSDETVSIDAAGTVAPHPKPLSVVVDPQRLRNKEQLSPDDLGFLPTPDEGRLARLVVLHRGAEGRRGLARLATAEGMLQLIEQSSSLAQVPRPLQVLMGLIEECGGLWTLAYDEIEDHVDELVELLDEPPPHAEPAFGPRLTWHPGESELPAGARRERSAPRPPSVGRGGGDRRRARRARRVARPAAGRPDRHGLAPPGAAVLDGGAGPRGRAGATARIPRPRRSSARPWPALVEEGLAARGSLA